MARPHFYEPAGFDVERYDDEFAFVRVDDQSVFDLVPDRGHGPSNQPRRLLRHHRRADDWHARFAAAGLPVRPLEDMPWGMHEFALTDPSGNHIRVGRSKTEGRRKLNP